MKFDDLIASIDALDDEGIQETVDWQMTKSPAARCELLSLGIDGCTGQLLDGSMGRAIDRLIATTVQALTELIFSGGLTLDISTWFPDPPVEPPEPAPALEQMRQLLARRRNTGPHADPLVDGSRWTVLPTPVRCAQCQRFLYDATVDTPAPVYCAECRMMRGVV